MTEKHRCGRCLQSFTDQPRVFSLKNLCVTLCPACTKAVVIELLGHASGGISNDEETGKDITHRLESIKIMLDSMPSSLKIRLTQLACDAQKRLGGHTMTAEEYQKLPDVVITDTSLVLALYTVGERLLA